MRLWQLGLLCTTVCSAWTPWFSWGGGYTHYQASELNRSMELFAKRAADSSAGFNHFSIEQFNGHPYQYFGLGLEQGPWRFSLESDFWVEDFRQSNIPFYTGRNRDTRLLPGQNLSCAQLNQAGFNPVENSLLGCIQARETFTFLPISAGLSYQWNWRSKWFARIGYQAGIMAGKANLLLQTHYSAGSGHDDTLSMDLYPGLNLLQKFSLESEYRPWSFLGLALRAGWRFSELAKVELRNIQGKSQILSLAFSHEFQEGDRFYIESFRGSGSDQDALTINQSKNFSKDPKYYNLIQGDFNGWNAGLTLNLYWKYHD